MARLKWSSLWAACLLAAVGLTAAHPFLYMRGTRHGYGRNIRPLPCVSKGGETGVCMFAWDCMKANGTHLGTCIDRFYFGSCCKMEQARPPPGLNEIPSGSGSGGTKPLGVDASGPGVPEFDGQLSADENESSESLESPGDSDATSGSASITGSGSTAGAEGPASTTGTSGEAEGPAPATGTGSTAGVEGAGATAGAEGPAPATGTSGEAEGPAPATGTGSTAGAEGAGATAGAEGPAPATGTGSTSGAEGAGATAGAEGLAPATGTSGEAEGPAPATGTSGEAEGPAPATGTSGEAEGPAPATGTGSTAGAEGAGATAGAEGLAPATGTSGEAEGPAPATGTGSTAGAEGAGATAGAEGPAPATGTGSTAGAEGPAPATGTGSTAGVETPTSTGEVDGSTSTGTEGAGSTAETEDASASGAEGPASATGTEEAENGESASEVEIPASTTGTEGAASGSEGSSSIAGEGAESTSGPEAPAPTTGTEDSGSTGGVDGPASTDAEDAGSTGSSEGEVTTEGPASGSGMEDTTEGYDAPPTTEVSVAVDPSTSQPDLPAGSGDSVDEDTTVAPGSGSSSPGVTESQATSPSMGTATPVSPPATESPTASEATIVIETEEPQTMTTMMLQAGSEIERPTTTEDAGAATISITVSGDAEDGSDGSQASTEVPAPAAATFPPATTEESPIIIPVTTIAEASTTKPEEPVSEPFFPVFPAAASEKPEATTLVPPPESSTAKPDEPVTLVFPSGPVATGKPSTLAPTTVTTEEPAMTTSSSEEEETNEPTISENEEEGDSSETTLPDTDVEVTSEATVPETTSKPTAETTLMPTTAEATEKPEEPVVPTTLAPTVTAEQELLERLNNSKAKDICGKPVYPTRRIVGGSEATFGEWPWQVSLRQWRQVTFLHKCGAALVNENWAITAAHCVESVQPEQLLLRLGEFDLERSDEPYAFAERKVQIIATHPQFDSRTFEYDLALLRFYEPVNFQPNIIPICVPEDDYDFIGDTGFVTGWGRLYEGGPLHARMQEVEVPVISNDECAWMFLRSGGIVGLPHIMMCAGYAEGKKDACEGDSGGPLVIQRDGVWNLAGVISWGIGCALPNQPGVYTRISEFREWIQKIVVF
ncbi:mucin-19-like isoform X2 [Penaeus chinensis]|uniref:mucin-19-like isoform X2 n=1 Tax=Penaeus chinensis TaxID=139456 RepID=UPI001FB7643C|nr:mucin-19-like isoform X2 [Penaeus chinensis]